MKKILFILLFIPYILSAQQLITTAGGEDGGVVWSMGEVLTLTLSDANSTNFLTQGLLQPEHQSSTKISSPNKQLSAISVYPNPVVDRLFISSADQVYGWTLYSALGEMLDSGNPQGIQSGEINMSGYPAGYYMLVVATAEGKNTIKVVK